MTHTEICALLDALKRPEEQPLPVLPPADPDDFYIVNGPESLAAVLAEMDGDGSENTMDASLRDAGFGGAGPM